MKVMYTFISLSAGEKKYIDLARAKSKALVNIYSLLKQNMKSCKLSGDGNETVGVISKKKQLYTCNTLFCTFLCRCFARLNRETSRNFLVTCFMSALKNVFFH